MTQTALNTTNATADLACMNAEGWRLISVGNGQWAGGDHVVNAQGLTLFFEKPLNSNSEGPSRPEVASGSSGVAPNPLNRGGRRKK
jgi:hypothetical protein